MCDQRIANSGIKLFEKILHLLNNLLLRFMEGFILSGYHNLFMYCILLILFIFIVFQILERKAQYL